MKETAAMTDLVAMSPSGPRAGFAPLEVFRRQPALAWFGLLMWALMIPTGLAAMSDPRLVDGVGTWIKPLKFEASIGLFSLTAAWMFGYIESSARRSLLARLVVLVIIAANVFEIAYILFQSLRAERSHFNVSDPVHGALYAMMGLAATAIVSTSLGMAWLVARRGEPVRAPFRDAVVLGLVLTTVLGGGFGWIMGARLSHGVGLDDPARALPLLGWSMVGGDLRPAHFLGIHAQQLIPLLALAVPGRGGPSRLAVWGLAAAYVVLTLAVGAEALAGRPLISD